MEIHASSSPLADLACDVLIVGISSEVDADLADLDAAFSGQLLPWTRARSFKGKEGSSLILPGLGHVAATTVVLVGLADRSDRAMRVAAGAAGRAVRSQGGRQVAFHIPGCSLERGAAILEWLVAGNYVYDVYKPEDERTAPVESLTWLGELPAGAVDRAAKLSRWRAYCRDLINAPPADLYPATLAERAQSLAELADVRIEVWAEDRLAEEDCVGILAVGQGSPRSPRLIRASYRPEGARQHIALVGKGVTFDAGGLSLKPTSGMQTMRCDMGGAATVLAATAAAADLRIPVAIDCFVGAAENMNDGNSYKLGDILRYRNGVTVEIHNTDAEGRLVMADCLIRACEVEGVSHVIDAATLTGAATIAVGPDYAGLFTADDALAEELLAAARGEVEGLWRLPLYPPYTKLLKGEWAQIKNVGIRQGGASTAAAFLEHFVTDEVRWAHLDIAASSFHDKSNSHYAAGATGEMVRTLVRWLESLD